MGLRAQASQGRVRRGAGAVAITDAPAVRAPAEPYRGIHPFRFEDHAIFVAREEETRLLAGLVIVYRGSLLYGHSGNGKSSLVNAGLLPRASALGMVPVVVRVQPLAGAELVVDQVAITDADGEVIPFLFDPDGEDSSRIVLSVAAFEERLLTLTEDERPLIIFDQFEEILTLFEHDDGLVARRAITALIGRLLRSRLPVKLLFAFREDYLGAITQLLHEHPDLVDQALRLGPPSADDLTEIIRGPFERFPGHFKPEIDSALAERLRAELAERFGTGEVSLSEVQTVCLRLWRSADPAALLAEKKVQGLLEDELAEALDKLADPGERAAAVALLSQMVTADGTRDVVSAEELRRRVAEAGEEFPPALLDKALGRLEDESKLVRRERRRDIYLYEITSEFLVPWISQRREETRVEQAKRRDRRRLRIFASIAAGLLVLLAIMAAAALWALQQRSEARDQRSEARDQTKQATSLALVASSQEAQETRPDVALGLAFEAYRQRDRPESRSAVMRSLLAARKSGVRQIRLAADVVYTVAYSPDGAILAYAGYDGAVRLLDRSGRQLAALRGHKGAVNSVAFSPDGKRLASAGEDGTIRLWNPVTHQAVARIGGRAPVYALAFSPDSTQFASAGYDSWVRIWSSTTHKQLDGIEGSSETVINNLAFSPDGDTVAYAPDDGTVGVWKLGTDVPKFLGTRTKILRLAYSPDGETLAMAGKDRRIQLWDLETDFAPLLPKQKKAFTDIAFSPDGKILASATDDYVVRLWDPAKQTLLARLRGHTAEVQALTFSPDGTTLASAGLDSTVRLWNTATRMRADLLRHTDTVYAVSFSPDGKILASGDLNGEVRLWDLASSARLDHLAPQHDSVIEVAFSPKGTSFAYAGGGGDVRLRSSTSPYKRLPDLTQHKDAVYALAFSPAGDLVASAGADKTIRLTNPITHRRMKSLRGHTDAVIDVAFSPDGKTLASASNDGSLRLWDVASAKQIFKHSDRSEGVYAVAFSPDGKTLAYAPLDVTIRLLDLRTRKPLGRPLRGHARGVNALAFSPDGETLASAGEDGTVRVWDPIERKPLARFDGHKGWVQAIAYSKDGRTLASAGDDRTVRVWRDVLWSSPAQLRRSVCDILLGDVNEAGWKQYAADVPYRRSCP